MASCILTDYLSITIDSFVNDISSMIVEEILQDYYEKLPGEVKNYYDLFQKKDYYLSSKDYQEYVAIYVDQGMESLTLPDDVIYYDLDAYTVKKRFNDKYLFEVMKKSMEILIELCGKLTSISYDDSALGLLKKVPIYCDEINFNKSDYAVKTFILSRQFKEKIYDLVYNLGRHIG